MKKLMAKTPTVSKLANAFDVITIDSKLTFGKYKRKKMIDVVAENPGYVIWLHENSNLKLCSKLVVAAQLLVIEAEMMKGEDAVAAATTEAIAWDEIPEEDVF